MILIVLKIANAMIAETRLPDRPTRLQAEREPAFDVLYGALQRDFLCWREEQMDVVGHDDEFVQKIFSVIAIMLESFYQETRRCLATEDRLAVRGDGGDEEYAVGVHFTMVAR